MGNFICWLVDKIQLIGAHVNANKKTKQIKTNQFNYTNYD